MKGVQRGEGRLDTINDGQQRDAERRAWMGSLLCVGCVGDVSSGASRDREVRLCPIQKRRLQLSSSKLELWDRRNRRSAPRRVRPCHLRSQVAVGGPGPMRSIFKDRLANSGVHSVWVSARVRIAHPLVHGHHHPILPPSSPGSHHPVGRRTGTLCFSMPDPEWGPSKFSSCRPMFSQIVPTPAGKSHKLGNLQVELGRTRADICRTPSNSRHS